MLAVKDERSVSFNCSARGNLSCGFPKRCHVRSFPAIECFFIKNLNALEYVGCKAEVLPFDHATGM